MTLTSASARIGLMCGTFDPPHIGHLILAETAAIQLDLDEVRFLPVGQPPHKGNVTAALHRREMSQRAVVGNPRFIFDSTDLDRPPPHYTTTLLPLIQTQFPYTELILLLGADSLYDLPNWYRPQELLTHCQIAVADRPGTTHNWENLINLLPAVASRTIWLSGFYMNVSSTMIRNAIQAGYIPRYVLPEPVRQYIANTRLYR